MLHCCKPKHIRYDDNEDLDIYSIDVNFTNTYIAID